MDENLQGEYQEVIRLCNLTTRLQHIEHKVNIAMMYTLLSCLTTSGESHLKFGLQASHNIINPHHPRLSARLRIPPVQVVPLLDPTACVAAQGPGGGEPIGTLAHCGGPPVGGGGGGGGGEEDSQRQ